MITVSCGNEFVYTRNAKVQPSEVVLLSVSDVEFCSTASTNIRSQHSYLINAQPTLPTTPLPLVQDIACSPKKALTVWEWSVTYRDADIETTSNNSHIWGRFLHDKFPNLNSFSFNYSNRCLHTTLLPQVPINSNVTSTL